MGDTAELERRALAKTWFYPFRLKSGQVTRTYGAGELDPIHHTRRQMLDAALEHGFGQDFSALSAVDLASHQGWFATHLAERGFGRVLGIDAREEHVADASLIRDALALGTLDYRQSDVHALDTAALGRHDL